MGNDEFSGRGKSRDLSSRTREQLSGQGREGRDGRLPDCVEGLSSMWQRNAWDGVEKVPLLLCAASPRCHGPDPISVGCRLPSPGLDAAAVRGALGVGGDSEQTASCFFQPDRNNFFLLI